MGEAVIVAVLSVALGALLGLAPRAARELLSPVRCFAVVSAFVVVFVNLLPDALEAHGALGLGVFVLAMLAPGMVSRLARRLTPAPQPHGHGHGHEDEPEHGSAGEIAPSDVTPMPSSNGRPSGGASESHSVLALELSYAGLLLHQLGDGLGLASFAGPHHEGHHHVDVLAALAAHIVPMTALAVVAFSSRSGAMAGLLRALGMAAATVLGVALAGLASHEMLEQAEPMVSAVVGGLLVHVVLHDWGSPVAARGRIGEVIAVLAGCSLLLLGGSGHGEHDLRPAWFDLALSTAPALLTALLVGGALEALVEGPDMRGSQGKGSAWRMVMFALLSSGSRSGVAHATAKDLARKGVSAGAAFAAVAPALRPDVLLVTLLLGGERLFALRTAGVLLVGVVVLLLGSAGTPRRESWDALAPSGGGFLGRLDSLVIHLGPRWLLGLAAAMYASLLAPRLAGSALGIAAVVVFLGVVALFCEVSATLVFAVLAAAGLPVAFLVAGLLAGSALRLVRWMISTPEDRGAAIGGWLAAIAVPLGLYVAGSGGDGLVAHEPALVQKIAAGLVALVALRTVYLGGVDGWLRSLGAHAHDHGRASDHA